MPTDERHRDAGRPLPLTEPRGNPDAGLLIDENAIRRLVDTFYDTVKRDDVLGPIFAAHVGDWSHHLPKMYDFWSTVVLRTGRYAGRPLEAHQRISGLRQDHFNRWIELWQQTVTRVIPPCGQEAFITPARRMAASMSAVLLRDGDPL